MNHPNPDISNVSKSKSIPLPSVDARYTILLAGSPETVSMRSGYVVLSPGETVGLHTSGDHEEVIVPLSGTGELIVPGMENIPIKPGCILYNPPHTQHDVINTGDKPLKYIFIVADA
jgi:oxalate decarboxylase/phosphoglucose isomerase-like protein (cupin superfamily)